MKFPLWATLFTLLGIAILCSLGTWQLKRLEWKTALLAELEASYQADPMQFELTPEHLAALPQDRQIVRSFAEGIYLHDKELLIGPRTHDGKPGYHVITPFETIDNHLVLVNRGWVPLSAKEQGFSRPDEPLIITGTARKPSAPTRFMPENSPAQGHWYRLDLHEIAAAKGLEDLMPYVLYADPKRPNAASYPLAAATRLEMPNNHMSYALFWFSMAGVLALIYGLRFKPWNSIRGA